MPKPIAIITGASRGLGEKLSVKLSDKYFIYLISRNKENLLKAKSLILKKIINVKLLNQIYQMKIQLIQFIQKFRIKIILNY